MQQRDKYSFCARRPRIWRTLFCQRDRVLAAAAAEEMDRNTYVYLDKMAPISVDSFAPVAEPSSSVPGIFAG